MGRKLGSKNNPKEVEHGEIVDATVEQAQAIAEPSNALRRTIEKVRQVSTNKDHKGEGEPLCHNCGHRSDMHYIEHRWIEQKMAKNLQGDIGMIEIQRRQPIYDGPRPCQHACLCKAYE